MPTMKPLVAAFILACLCSIKCPSACADENLPQTKEPPAHRQDEQLPRMRRDATFLSFTPYKPMYFLIGNPESKAQLSVKTRILRSFDLYVAYSQLMMWQIFKPSAPMKDVNYNPEFFYRLPVSTESRDHWLDIGLFEHESNGIGTGNSRSWNRTYFRYHSRTPSDRGHSLIWTAKAWIPYLLGPTNPDILKYRGLWEVNVELAHFWSAFLEPGSVIFRIYPGGPSFMNPLQGGQELTFRAQSRWQQLLLPIVFQLFHGTGESLLDYREEIWRFRAGIGF
jgi:outer membrane phospholipase A